MRYFFEDELGRFLRDAGLTLRAVTAFPDLENPPSVAAWNVLVVAAG
jgi:hypothetical protein